MKFREENIEKIFFLIFDKKKYFLYYSPREIS